MTEKTHKVWVTIAMVITLLSPLGLLFHPLAMIAIIAVPMGIAVFFFFWIVWME